MAEGRGWYLVGRCCGVVVWYWYKRNGEISLFKNIIPEDLLLYAINLCYRWTRAVRVVYARLDGRAAIYLLGKSDLDISSALVSDVALFSLPLLFYTAATFLLYTCLLPSFCIPFARRRHCVPRDIYLVFL